MIGAIFSGANAPELALAFSVVVGALGGFVTQIFGLKASRKTIEKVETIKDATGEIHTLVNDRSDKQDKRIDQLTTSLEGSNTAVPPKNG